MKRRRPEESHDDRQPQRENRIGGGSGDERESNLSRGVRSEGSNSNQAAHPTSIEYGGEREDSDVGEDDERKVSGGESEVSSRHRPFGISAVLSHLEQQQQLQSILQHRQEQEIVHAISRSLPGSIDSLVRVQSHLSSLQNPTSLASHDMLQQALAQNRSFLPYDLQSQLTGYHPSIQTGMISRQLQFPNPPISPQEYLALARGVSGIGAALSSATRSDRDVNPISQPPFRHQLESIDSLASAFLSQNAGLQMQALGYGHDSSFHALPSRASLLQDEAVSAVVDRLSAARLAADAGSSGIHHLLNQMQFYGSPSPVTTSVPQHQAYALSCLNYAAETSNSSPAPLPVGLQLQLPTLDFIRPASVPSAALGGPFSEPRNQVANADVLLSLSGLEETLARQAAVAQAFSRVPSAAEGSAMASLMVDETCDRAETASSLARDQEERHVLAMPRDEPRNIRAAGRQEVPYDAFHLPLAAPSDQENLNDYQCLIRQQIFLFQAGPEDLECNAQGRNRPIVLKQVGIICRHCFILNPNRRRARGVVYFPARLDGLYQAAQNMAMNHFTESCLLLPNDVRERLSALKLHKKKTPSVSGAGKSYWVKAAQSLGVAEGENGLIMNNSNQVGTS